MLTTVSSAELAKGSLVLTVNRGPSSPPWMILLSRWLCVGSSGMEARDAKPIGHSCVSV